MSLTQTENAGIAEWRAVVEDLFRQIEGWTKDGTTWPRGEDLPPNVDRRRWTIEHDYDEPYDVPQLLLTKNGRYLWVRPIARRVVGGDGRVDLQGSEGPLTLLYDKTKHAWCWIDDRLVGKARPLTGELFRELAELFFQ